jgi:coenzyme A diphosphatase NUDT7
LREDIIRSFSGRKAKILGHENTIKSAVLLPLFFDSGECYVLFEKRARTMKRQPGEICFPGGTREPSDDDSEYTAIRESSEELGRGWLMMTSCRYTPYSVCPSFLHRRRTWLAHSHHR